MRVRFALQYNELKGVGEGVLFCLKKMGNDYMYLNGNFPAASYRNSNFIHSFACKL